MAAVSPTSTLLVGAAALVAALIHVALSAGIILLAWTALSNEEDRAGNSNLDHLE